jgi:MFS family permease
MIGDLEARLPSGASLRNYDTIMPMDEKILKLKSHNRFVIYILGFLFTLHYTLPVYISSTFLNQFTSVKIVGLIYTIASFLTILVFFLMPKILGKIGNYRTATVLLIIEFISLIGLSDSSNVCFIFTFFIASFIAVAIINFNMDIFLENLSSSVDVGKIRGFFLTSANLAWIVAPIITSFILTNADYWKIYLAAAALIIPVLFLFSSNLKTFKDPSYTTVPVIKTIKQIWQNKNILGSFMTGFLLQFFYAWMVIYMPIYLHDYIGFDWNQLGIMFAIMLLPFIFIEIPLGRLADSRWGEKEIMTIGFIITGMATGLITFITTKNFYTWTTLLFITRIGASMVEIMTETYFFKKIDGTSVNFISFYRTLRPWAYVISPIIATIIFSITRFEYIFVILGFIMLYGIRFSLSIEDTK